ncbi:hypothetical protein F5Y15DRAFT_1927 [Xylariaceae sp. FL0016]|nr:hypothetical protein F5Y15DRAFT_1927 [Xylariaceae sp. FL0016]
MACMAFDVDVRAESNPPTPEDGTSWIRIQSSFRVSSLERPLVVLPSSSSSSSSSSASCYFPFGKSSDFYIRYQHQSLPQMVTRGTFEYIVAKDVEQAFCPFSLASSSTFSQLFPYLLGILGFYRQALESIGVSSRCRLGTINQEPIDAPDSQPLVLLASSQQPVASSQQHWLAYVHANLCTLRSADTVFVAVQLAVRTFPQVPTQDSHDTYVGRYCMWLQKLPAPSPSAALSLLAFGAPASLPPWMNDDQHQLL